MNMILNGERVNAPTELSSLFHDFVVVNRRTGSRMALTQIGQTREDAEHIVREYNLKGIDFETEYELLDPLAEVAVLS